MSTVDERVAAGAAWLDEHRPGWIDRINLVTLDLGDPCRCVLGQDFGEFAAGLNALDFDAAAYDRAVDLGFYSGVDLFEEGESGWAADREYRDLTDAWRRLIEARRSS